ncbi:adenosylmethionine--8-amino-7-oxononanoate transaminase [Fangia hongkongensis]|uniref:adenosylmethionine--8-amino-7-oxononanoate transaminase n=1 Tax=Fangia hongkongensis TaxID=270495 RepID=UPI00047621C3|nr:adenosylmethionine--8-amino-7-oxononanoate transaminase [Fangia hongkongensis]MBK2124084.1 adenosylmethionine--8-amino-7-oxononanoate transaminase [Fangia hongkongensis]
MYSTPIWHPCSQMKDYESFTPLSIQSASKSYLTLQTGEKLIDAISSWWCKSLGHNHPKIKQAIITQLDSLEHTILANTTNQIIEALTESLCDITKMDKVLFASDGSCAVEIAMKMSIQARVIRGQSDKCKFIALQNAYHGETAATLSVSDLGLYKNAYQSLLFDCEYIPDIPYVTGEGDPLWHDAEKEWLQAQSFLNQHRQMLNAIIIEPIVQGAGGMLVYSQDFIKRLGLWCKENDVYLIADEIMTGIGRTGKMLALEHADIQADFICLSKGLTSGVLPLSVTLTHESIYEIFYDDYETYKAFMHSHTHSGNTLASACALSVLEIFQKENTLEYVQQTLHPTMLQNMHDISHNTKLLHNIRSIGGIIAADIKSPKFTRSGYRVFQQAVKLGALLRPLGNTIYWMPPLNTEVHTLNELAKITEKALLAY